MGATIRRYRWSYAALIRFAVLGTVFVPCLGLATGRARAATPAVAIVVNASTPVDDLTLAELRKVFLGDRQFWGPGQRVVLLVRAPQAPERDVVLHSIYQMSEGQFRQYWIAKVFRAEITSGRKVVYSTDMTDELIPAIPGAIGFKMADKLKPGEKVLRIKGKLPGDPGYPLR